MPGGSMETDAAAPALPDDVLAAILRRLLARSLAASRCVCKAWRDVVDEHGLLLRLRRLLPHLVSGIFANYVDHGKPHFFARPAPTSSFPSPSAVVVVDGNFSYVRPERLGVGWYKVADHCNGLVLYRNEDHGGDMYVCNPTTRRWVRLPPPEPELAGGGDDRRAFLAFSPATSRHYQVLVAPPELLPKEHPHHHRTLLDAAAEPAGGDTEWPPPRWTWHVFSSRSGRWRERAFARRGKAAGVVADLRMDSLGYSRNPRWRYAVHRRGALYVHCRGEYITRLSLSAGEYSYHVIKSPIDRSECYKNNMQSFLGKSQGNVYLVAINTRRLRVWMLKDDLESPQQHDPTAPPSEWILKHDRVLRPDDWWGVVAHRSYHYQKIQREEGPWILDDYYKYTKEDKRKLDWSSDGEDNVICSNNAADQEEDQDEEEFVYPETYHFIGFHPYKEVIFLETLNVAVAYHLRTSKVQFLGILKPHDWNYGLYDSFVYTPCQDLRHRS